MVLGIAGMQGLVLGGTAVGHHPWHSAHAIGHVVHAVPPAAGSHTEESVPVTGEGVGPVTDDRVSSTVALCVALLLAIALGFAGVRRTTWVATLGRPAPRPAPPAAPLLRTWAPVPRFTVMRC